MALIHPEDLPAPEIKLQILKLTITKLTEAGYVFIGMDHFAKPEDELAIALNEKKLYRNFQGYSTHAGTDLYAMGVTAISQLQNVYTQNFKTEKEYFDAINNETLPIARGYRLSADDILRREVITNLMCNYELDFTKIEEKYKINFKEYFAWGLNNLSEMENDKLVSVKDNEIIVTGLGKLLIRNIVMNFDGYIELKEDTAKYSRTV
jgi:oxygen-independent coproporphyrinogen-3 oxidase